jgi:hypothetical protein
MLLLRPSRTTRQQYISTTLDNLQTSFQKHKSHPRLIFTLTRSFVLSLITCYSLLTTQQRFDSRGLLGIQYCPLYFYIYPYPSLLLPVCTVHYNRAPVSSATPHVWNQNSLVNSKHVHLIPWDWTLIFEQGSTPCIPKLLSYKTMTLQYEECSRLFSGTLPQLTQPPSFLHSFHNCQNNTF